MLQQGVDLKYCPTSISKVIFFLLNIMLHVGSCSWKNPCYACQRLASYKMYKKEEAELGQLWQHVNNKTKRASKFTTPPPPIMPSGCMTTVISVRADEPANLCVPSPHSPYVQTKMAGKKKRKKYNRTRRIWRRKRTLQKVRSLI